MMPMFVAIVTLADSFDAIRRAAAGIPRLLKGLGCRSGMTQLVADSTG